MVKLAGVNLVSSYLLLCVSLPVLLDQPETLSFVFIDVDVVVEFLFLLLLSTIRAYVTASKEALLSYFLGGGGRNLQQQEQEFDHDIDINER